MATEENKNVKDKDEEENPITKRVIKNTFLIVLAGTIVIGLIPVAITKWFYDAKIPGDAGLIGDSFGMVNAILSGLAFAGVILTLIMQKFELELQRKELKEAREQYERSANAQEMSERQLHRQVDLMFVSSYLALLDMRIQSEKNYEDALGPIKVLGEGINELQTRIIMDRLKRENEKALSNLTERFDAYAVDKVYKKYMETNGYTRTLTRQLEDGIIEHDATAKADGQAPLSRCQVLVFAVLRLSSTRLVETCFSRRPPVRGGGGLRSPRVLFWNCATRTPPAMVWRCSAISWGDNSANVSRQSEVGMAIIIPR